MKYLITLIIPIFLFACGGKKADDGGLNLTDEQLNEIMKRKPMTNNTNPGANSDEAMLQLEASYQTDSSLLDNVYNLAFMYCSKCVSDSTMQSCPKAEQYLSRVIILKADHRQGKAYYNRALCLEHQGKYESALADLNKFIAMHSNNPKPPVNFYFQKAVLLHKMGRSPEACTELKKAEKIDTTGISGLGWSCK